MKHQTILFSIGLCMLFLFSCIKDQSIPEVNDLHELNISGIQDTIIVSVDDILKIQPEITSTSLENGSYDYVWYSYATSQQFAADTLSKEKNLEATINMFPGVYTLIFRVMDRNTGVFYKETKRLIVRNDYSPGIMILGKENNEATLHFYNTSTKKYISDVYKKSNSDESLGMNPVSISYYAQNYSMPGEVLILCKDNRGGVFADPNTFQKSRELKKSFYVDVEESAFLHTSKYVARENNLQDYVIINGKPYNRAVNSGDLRFKPEMVGDFFVSNQVFSANSSRPVFFDTQKRVFLSHNNTAGALNPLKLSNPESLVDPNNVGLDVVYAGGISADNFFGLFKTPNQPQFHILRMQINGFGLTFNATDKYIMNGEGIENATAFSSSSSLPNYLFYASGGKCYVYNTLSGSGGLLFDMGSSVEITVLKMNGFEVQVGYTDQNQSAKKAGFALMNISTDGGIKATETLRMDGITDYIVDLTYKQ